MGPLWKRVDAGPREWDGSVSGKVLQAGADVVAEELDVEAGEVRYVGLEFAQGGGEEAGRAEGVVAAEVVEGDSDLNEALQEGFFRLGGVEPDAFPGFMGFRSTRRRCSRGWPSAGGALDPIEGHGRSSDSGQVAERCLRIR